MPTAEPITDELAVIVHAKTKRGEDGDTDDDSEDGGTFWMMSASKQIKLLGAAQSLIAGITDAFRTATIDHSKVFEVLALRSAITDTMAALMVFSAKPSPKCGNERI